MNEPHPVVLRRLIWAGPAFVAAFFVGLMPLAGFIPPPAPSASAADIVRLYQQHGAGIRTGCFVMIVALVLLVPWGVALAEYMRRIPSVSPALINGQLVSLGVATTLIMITPTSWAIAAFRPGAVSADLTQTLNDIGWIFLDFTFPPFVLWCILLALAIFADSSPQPVFPRWTAYLSLWNGLQLVGAGFVIFFKTGPFAWNGLIAFYIPLGVFLAWIIGLTVALLRATTTRGAGASTRAINQEADGQPTGVLGID